MIQTVPFDENLSVPIPMKSMDEMKKSECRMQNLVIDNFLSHKPRIGVKCTCGLKGAFKYENVGITIHVQRKGSKTELIPSLELQKHFFILLL